MTAAKTDAKAPPRRGEGEDTESGSGSSPRGPNLQLKGKTLAEQEALLTPFSDAPHVVEDYCKTSLGMEPYGDLEANRTKLRMRLAVDDTPASALGAHDTTLRVLERDVQRWVHHARKKKPPAGAPKVQDAATFFSKRSGGAPFVMDTTLQVNPAGVTPIDVAALSKAGRAKAGPGWNPLVYPNDTFRKQLDRDFADKSGGGSSGTKAPPTPDAPISKDPDPPTRKTTAPDASGADKKDPGPGVLDSLAIGRGGYPEGGEKLAGGSITVGELPPKVKLAIWVAGLSNTAKWTLWNDRKKSLVLHVHLSSQAPEKGALLTVDVATLLKAVGPALGSAAARLGIKAPAERLVFVGKSQDEIQLNLGGSDDPTKQMVGFKTADVVKAALSRTLSGLKPSRIDVSHDKVGRVAFVPSGSVRKSSLPRLGGVETDNEEITGRLGIEGKAIVSAHYAKGSVGVSVAPADASGKPRFVTEVHYEALAAKVEAVLSALGDKVKAWLAGRKKKHGKSWLAKLFRGLKDGILWFGDKAHSVGLRVVDVVKRVLAAGADAGRFLASLVPDVWDIRFPPKKRGREWDFDLGSLDILRHIPLPNVVPALEAIADAMGAGAEALVDATVQIGRAAGKGAIWALGIVLKGARALWFSFDISGAIGRLLKAAGRLGKAFLDKLMPKGGGKLVDTDLDIRLGKDWVLRISDAKGNLLGFDLTKVLDGADASDLIPVEVKIASGGSEVAYGAPVRDKDSDKHAVIASKPQGDPFAGPVTLPAPGSLAGYFGTDAKKKPQVGMTVYATDYVDGSGTLTLYMTYPAGKPERALRYDIGAPKIRKALGWLSDKFGGVAGAVERSRWHIDKDLSSRLGGIALGYGTGEGKSLRDRFHVTVGYSLTTLLDAWNKPELLQRPDVVQGGVKDAVEAKVGKMGGTPRGYTRWGSAIPLPDKLTELVGVKSGSKGFVYAPPSFDPDKDDLGVFLDVKGSQRGMQVVVAQPLIEKARAKVSKLIAKASKGLGKLGKGGGDKDTHDYRFRARMGPKGLELGVVAAPGLERSFVRYDWASIIGMATGGVDAASLIPDEVALHTSVLSVTKERARGELPEDARRMQVKTLPGPLQAIVMAFGLSEKDQIVLPREGQGRVPGDVEKVGIHAYVQSAGRWSHLRLEIPIAALLGLLLPDFVLKKLKKKRRRGRFGFRLIEREGTPHIEVSVGKKGGKLQLVVGWDVATLAQILLNLDEVIDNPGSLTTSARPDNFALSIARKNKLKMTLGLSSGWKPEGKTKIPYAPMELLADALGDITDGKQTVDLYMHGSPSEFASSLKDALMGKTGGFVDIGGVYVVVAPAKKEGDKPGEATVFRAELALHYDLALKLARLIPGAGFVITALKTIARIAKNPEDLKHMPGAAWEFIKALPDIGEFLGGMDWENMEWGKLLAGLAMTDIPSFKHMKHLLKALNNAPPGTIPDHITGDDIFKAAFNGDVEATAKFAEKLNTLSAEDRAKVWKALEKMKQGGGEVPDELLKMFEEGGEIHVTMAADDLRELADAEHALTSAATAKAIHDAGGGDKAANKAFKEALGGGSMSGAQRVKLVGKHLAGTGPYKGLVAAGRAGGMSIDEIHALIGKYAPMSTKELIDILAKLPKGEGGIKMVAAILAYRAGIVTDASLAMSRDPEEIRELAKAQVALDGKGLKIQLEKAMKANPRWHARLRYNPQQLLAIVKGLPEGITVEAPVKSAAFAVGVALLQSQLGISVDGVAGPQTIKRAFESRYTGGALRRVPGYRRAVHLIQQAERRRQRERERARVDRHVQDTGHPPDPPPEAWVKILVVWMEGDKIAQVHKRFKAYSWHGREYISYTHPAPPLTEFVSDDGYFWRPPGEPPKGDPLFTEGQIKSLVEPIKDPKGGNTVVLKHGAKHKPSGLNIKFPEQHPDKIDVLDASNDSDLIIPYFHHIEASLSAPDGKLIVYDAVLKTDERVDPGEWSDVRYFDRDVAFRMWVPRKYKGGW